MIRLPTRWAAVWMHVAIATDPPMPAHALFTIDSVVLHGTCHTCSVQSAMRAVIRTYS